MRRWLSLVAMLCLTTGVAVAQPPIPWWENPVANGLTLSEAQKESINRIVAQFRERLTAERQEAERAEIEFENVVNADTLEYGRGWRAIDQLVMARAAFTKDMSAMILRLRNVLTAEQWRTVQDRQEGRGGRDGGKGRGPDGRPRRPGPPPAQGSTPAH